MKRTRCAIGILLSTIMLLFLMAGPALAETGLSLTASTDKSRYQLGETLTLTMEVKCDGELYPDITPVYEINLVDPLDSGKLITIGSLQLNTTDENGKVVHNIPLTSIGTKDFVDGQYKIFCSYSEMGYEPASQVLEFTIGQAITVEDPVAAPTGGIYTSPQLVTLTCATDGSSIYYTTDGTSPLGQDNVPVGTFYDGEIPVSVSTIIKAVAVKSGVISNIVTFDYNIQAPLELNLLVTDAAYVSWQRPVYISGTSNKSVSWQVYVVDQNGVIASEIYNASGSNFSWQWAPTDTYEIPRSGNYQFKVIADDGMGGIKTETETFYLYNYPLVFRNLQTADFYGSEKSQFAHGDGWAAQAELENLDNLPTSDILLIVQVKDYTGKVVFLGFSRTGVKVEGERAVAGIGFVIPSDMQAGTYSVETFAWNGWLSGQSQGSHRTFADTYPPSTFTVQ